MTLGIDPSATVLLSGFVLLPFKLAGQAQATSLQGRPTVQPSPTSCTHERSGHVFAPMARTRAFNSLYTREKSK